MASIDEVYFIHGDDQYILSMGIAPIYFIYGSFPDQDPLNFGQPDSFHETDPASKKSAKIMENFQQNQQPKS